MLKIWNAANFRRTAGALSLILAPVVFAASEITFPSTNGPVDLFNVSVGPQRTLVLVDSYLGIVSAILFVPAFFALAAVIRERGVVLAHVALIPALVGVLLAHVGKGVLQLMVWVMAGPGVDHAAMARFLGHNSDGAALLPVFLGDQLFTLGLVLFAIAVYRSRFGYRWAGPAIVLGVILDIGLSVTPLPDVIASIVSDGCFVAGFIAIGYRILRMTDQQWAGSPLADGRPATPAPAGHPAGAAGTIA